MENTADTNKSQCILHACSNIMVTDLCSEAQESLRILLAIKSSSFCDEFKVYSSYSYNSV